MGHPVIGCVIAFVVVLSATNAMANAGRAEGDDTSGFADAVFSDPTTIDNQWFPLVPGDAVRAGRSGESRAGSASPSPRVHRDGPDEGRSTV